LLIFSSYLTDYFQCPRFGKSPEAKKPVPKGNGLIFKSHQPLAHFYSGAINLNKSPLFFCVLVNIFHFILSRKKLSNDSFCNFLSGNKKQAQYPRQIKGDPHQEMIAPQTIQKQ